MTGTSRGPPDARVHRIQARERRGPGTPIHWAVTGRRKTCNKGAQRLQALLDDGDLVNLSGWDWIDLYEPLRFAHPDAGVINGMFRIRCHTAMDNTTTRSSRGWRAYNCTFVGTDTIYSSVMVSCAALGEVGR